MNLNTIATNIATRFSAANLTAPSGLDNVTFSTHLLPNAITTTPCVLVKPPIGQFEYGPGIRHGELDFPVEFYLADASVLSVSASNAYAWYGTLLDQLTADYDLGGASEVIDGTITDTRVGTLTYAGRDYTGIQLTVRVRVRAGYPAST